MKRILHRHPVFTQLMVSAYLHLRNAKSTVYPDQTKSYTDQHALDLLEARYQQIMEHHEKALSSTVVAHKQQAFQFIVELAKFHQHLATCSKPRPCKAYMAFKTMKKYASFYSFIPPASKELQLLIRLNRIHIGIFPWVTAHRQYDILQRIQT